MKVVFVSWAPYCSRSDNIAREFCGKSYMVYAPFFGSNYFTILFKYLFQTVKTLTILLRERPDVVFIMAPPTTACFPVYVYTCLFPAGYIIDSHTMALLGERWKRVSFIHRFFSRRAITTIVTNDFLKAIIDSWGAPVTIVTDVPVEFPHVRLPHKKSGFTITLINTFSDDEPLENFMMAAKKLSDIQFYITGSLKQAKKRRRRTNYNLPHVQFTDFLSTDAYAGLLVASDCIVVLTTRDNTMQRGAYEAAYLGKPVITSDWGILKKTFYKGTLFVDNTPDGILAAILEMRKNHATYKEEIVSLLNEKKKTWIAIKEKLSDQIEKHLITRKTT